MTRLEKIVGSVMRSHRNILPPAKKRIDISYQGTFFAPQGSHKDMGDFYESMTQGLWGGVLQNRLLLGKSRVRIDSDDPTNICNFVKPDIINYKTKEMGESKAIISGKEMKLEDDQFSRYGLLQDINRGFALYLAFYRHNFPNIRSFEGTKEELFKSLSGATYNSIVLPFSLILELYQNRDPNMVYRYDMDRWNPYTGVKSHVLNRFLTEPERVIEETGLNKKDFVIKKYSSPKDFSIGGNKIKQFPIVRIRDKNHKKWIKNFRFDMTEHKGLQEEFEKWKSESLFKDYDPQEDGCSEEIAEKPQEEITSTTEENIPF